jgi:UDP-glucose 4-epimerase
VVTADLGERDGLRTAVADVDAICHLAALTGVRESFKRPNEYRVINTEGTIALLDLAVEAGRRAGRPVRFVQASTAAVYGAPTKQPIDESAVPAPTSPYGESKLAADEALREFAATGRIAAISLRAFNVAGSVAGYGDPGETRIIPRTLRVAAGLQPSLAINGDGSAVRDFVHVDDVARAYVLALDACRAGQFQVYNVGATGAGVREIVAAAESVTGRAVPVVHNPPQPEPPVLLADTRRIRAELGWRPERSSLEEIISDTWAALLERMRTVRAGC